MGASMQEVIIDTILDSVRIIPFLFLTYLVLEYFEHKAGNKTHHFIRKSGKAGPVVGGILGAFPQCGFSAAASSLYAGRVLSLGTLLAIYLSTSDEMLPILISESVSLTVILKILGIKIVIGILAGILIDILVRQKEDDHDHIHEMCEHDHCHCEKGVFQSALHHTINITIFLILVSFALNLFLFIVGEDALGSLIWNKPVIGQLLAGLVGMIPNCAASVVITQLYLEGAMSFGAMMAGLLSGAGIGILVLFRTNSSRRDNIRIAALLYTIGVVSGILIELSGFTI